MHIFLQISSLRYPGVATQRLGQDITWNVAHKQAVEKVGSAPAGLGSSSIKSEAYRKPG